MKLLRRAILSGSSAAVLAGSVAIAAETVTVASSDPAPPRAEEWVTTVHCAHAIATFTVAGARDWVSYVISRTDPGEAPAKFTGKLALGDSLASGRSLSRVGYACVGDGVLVQFVGATPKADGSLAFRTWTSVVRPDGTEVVTRNDVNSQKQAVEALK